MTAGIEYSQNPIKMKNTVKPTNQRFCSFCGAEMIENLYGAEICRMYYGDSPSIPVGSAYNKETGKRQYCYHYVCPKWENKLFGYSPHDEYFLEKIITL